MTGVRATATGAREEMIERRQAGETLRSIAADYGVSYEWVRQICAGVRLTVTCRRCGETFSPARSPREAVPVCPTCRARHCVVCGKGFSRKQWTEDDGEAHKSCRKESRGSKGGTTYRAEEPGIYRRIYKETGIVLDGYFVAREGGSGFRRVATLHEARDLRKGAGYMRLSRLARRERSE